MFISHRYKAIFVHIQRTGGNSVAKIFAQNDPELVETIPVDPSKNRTKHAWIADIRAAIGDDIFTRYTKFCVVRNPFERIVSWYAHLKNPLNEGDKPVGVTNSPDDQARKAAEEFALRFEAIGERVKRAVNENASSFDEFVMLPRDHPDGFFERFYANQLDYISIDGEVVVDAVLRFEDLNKDFAALAGRIGLPASLPHINASSRDSDYRKYYSEKTRAIIAERFHRDCERWGYAF